MRSVSKICELCGSPITGDRGLDLIRTRRAVAHRLCATAGMDERECYDFLRGNAIRCYGLDRFGINQ